MRTPWTPKYILGSSRKLPPVLYSKSCSWKLCDIHGKIPVLESLFNKELQSSFINKRLQQWCFLVNIAESLRSPVLKNICERLFLSDVISTRSIQSNLTFAQPILLEFLFRKENIKIISKIVRLCNSHIYNVYVCKYVMFYYKIPWF